LDDLLLYDLFIISVRVLIFVFCAFCLRIENTLRRYEREASQKEEDQPENIAVSSKHTTDQNAAISDEDPYIFLYLDLKRSPQLLIKKSGMARFARSLDPTEHKAWARSNTLCIELRDNPDTGKVFWSNRFLLYLLIFLHHHFFLEVDECISYSYYLFFCLISQFIFFLSFFELCLVLMISLRCGRQ
jgi:uncharacterized Zn finger protein (UPF0148 family)